MPNWCQNVLSADLGYDEISEFVMGVEGCFDLNRIIRTEDPDKDWGVKRNAINSEYNGEGEWYFDTPWVDPREAIMTLSKKFTDTTFTLKFFEGGCLYAGVVVIRGGRGYFNEFYENNEYYKFAFKEEFLNEEDYILIDNEYEYFDYIEELHKDGYDSILVPNINSLKINDTAIHPKGAWRTPDGIMTRQGVLYAYKV